MKSKIQKVQKYKNQFIIQWNQKGSVRVETVGDNGMKVQKSVFAAKYNITRAINKATKV
jgi:hypothetical protein